MLDGIRRVYKPDGTFLGKAETTVGNEILLVPAEIAEAIRVKGFLHIEETHTTKRWRVQVVGFHNSNRNRLVIQKKSDLPESWRK